VCDGRKKRANIVYNFKRLVFPKFKRQVFLKRMPAA
jgi:hypothetical protein